MKYYLLLVVIFIGLNACDDDIVERNLNSVGLEGFFNVKIGSSNLFELDSISIYGEIGNNIKRDSSHWFMKDSLILIDTVNDKTIVFYYERSIAKKEDDDFLFNGRYSLRVTSDELIRNENSVQEVLLTDPIENEKEFSSIKYLDPYSFFDFKGERIQVFKGWAQSVISFDPNRSEDDDFVVSVNYVDEENLIERRKAEASYRLNIGLYSSYKEIFDGQCNGVPDNCKDIEWIDKAEKGFIERIKWIKKLN